MTRRDTGMPYVSEGSRRLSGQDSVRLLTAEAPRPEGGDVSEGALAGVVARWLDSPQARAEIEAQLEQREVEADSGLVTSVYRLFDAEGLLLYVGVTNGGRRRIKQHAKDKGWWPAVASATFEHFETREDAFDAETKAIQSELPKYNLVGAPRPEPEMPSGFVRSRVRGLRRPAKIDELVSPEESMEALERQAQRHFGLDARELIRQFENGDIERDDPRLRYVVNLMATI